MLPVEFDFTLWRPLRLLGLNLDVMAAVTVNETLDELGLAQPQAVAFPVTAEDPSIQTGLVLDQLERAIAAGAQIIVFPELSTSPQIAEQIERRLSDDEAERLVICGSWHQTEPASGEPANTSVGLISGVRSRMQHRKLVEFGDLYPEIPTSVVAKGSNVRTRRYCRSTSPTNSASRSRSARTFWTLW
jgi:hypothetical protein